MSAISDSINAELTRAGVVIIANRIPFRTDGMMKDMRGNPSHWRVTVSRPSVHDRDATFEYSQGSAHKSAPDAASIVYSMRMDAEIGDMTFDEYVSEFGHPDSGSESYAEDKAHTLRILRACAKMRTAYRAMFTASDRETLTELFSDY